MSAVHPGDQSPNVAARNRDALWSAISGAIALLPMAGLMVVRQAGAVPIYRLVEYAFKTLVAFGLLPLAGIGVALLALVAITLGFLALRPDAGSRRVLAVAGIAMGAVAGGLLLLTVALSAARGALWLG